MKRFLALATLSLLFTSLPVKAQHQWAAGTWVEHENTSYWLKLRQPRIIGKTCYIFNGIWVVVPPLDYCEEKLKSQ